MTPNHPPPESERILLKPCPFCTCKSVELESVEDGDGRFICAYVECPACLARGPQEQILENAIDFWNECEPVKATP